MEQFKSFVCCVRHTFILRVLLRCNCTMGPFKKEKCCQGTGEMIVSFELLYLVLYGLFTTSSLYLGFLNGIHRRNGDVG